METDEISQAFDHPEVRAVALGAVPDRISLRDYVVEAEIGAFQPERGARQRLRFNIVVELGAQEGAATDDVDLILSYDRLTEAIATELAVERLNLLETLAERIAGRILAEPQPLRVFLRIEKLDRGPFALGVEIVRARSDTAPRRLAPEAQGLRPVVVYFAGPLPDLDRLAALGAPVVLCAGLSEGARSAGPNARRIDLLEIEQIVWAEAARDQRLSVVASRTELDWAIRRGQMILWAPSKLVLDTEGAPEAVGDGLGLAVWLSAQLGASRLLVDGPATLPDGCGVPVARL